MSLAIWDHTVLPVTRQKWTHPASTSARQTGTRFTYPEGWKAELNCLQMVTHPSTNRAQCQLTTLIKVNELTTTLRRHPKYGLVLLSVRIHIDKCVISGLRIHTAVCASISHTLALTLTLNPTLTLNVTLISSYLMNKHQYTQHNMSANWMTSRLRDQSAACCKKCQPVPIGCTDNTQICQYEPYWQ